MKNIKRIMLCFLFPFLLFTVSFTSFAHPGSTDSSGGHHNYRNRSGLGSYHFYHGYSAHLHPGVECPYCHATNVKKITNTSKAVHTAVFGIFSMGRSSKNFHCNNCGTDF